MLLTVTHLCCLLLNIGNRLETTSQARLLAFPWWLALLLVRATRSSKPAPVEVRDSNAYTTKLVRNLGIVWNRYKSHLRPEVVYHYKWTNKLQDIIVFLLLSVFGMLKAFVMSWFWITSIVSLRLVGILLRRAILVVTICFYKI